MLSCNDAASYVCRCGSTTKQHAGYVFAQRVPSCGQAQEQRAILSCNDTASYACRCSSTTKQRGAVGAAWTASPLQRTAEARAAAPPRRCSRKVRT